MNRCILHVGLPKTGTTTIERFLRQDLSDPAFLHCELGDVGTGIGRPVRGPFGPVHEECHHGMVWPAMERLPAADGGGMGTVAAYGRTTAGDMGHFRGVLLVHVAGRVGETPTVIGCRRIRGLRRGLLSSLEGLVGKYGTARFERRRDTFSADVPWELKDFRGRIQLFDNLFGKHAVQVAKYDPSSFERGCVVRDFCRRWGIRLTGSRNYRVHESLKLPALRLLYAYRRHGPGFGTGPAALRENRRMLHVLTQIEGPDLRFHSSLMEPILTELGPQRSWLEDRMGASFREDPYRYDAGAILLEEKGFSISSRRNWLGWPAEPVRDRYRPATGKRWPGKWRNKCTYSGSR